MLMENTIGVHPNLITHIFDLKGSQVDRLTKDISSPTTILKDLNYVKLRKENPDLVKPGSKDAKRLRNQMERDAKFLKN